MVKTKIGFRGKQQNLYTLSRKAWGYCLDNITAISKAKKLYTPSFIADQVAKVDVAEAIPDYYARKELTVESRQQMTEAALAITNDWQLLKGYITDAYDKSVLKSKLEAAGQPYYKEATNENWDSVASLINSAKLFMQANATALSANDNMPDTFPGEFETLATAFTNLRNIYFNKEDSKENLNSAKEEADAAILKTLMPMLRLSQRVFKNDPEKRSLFVYDSLLKQVRGNQAAGLKGVITAVETKLPLENVNIKAVSISEDAATYTATTDSKGGFDMNMASGVYDVEVSSPGYQTLIVAKRKIEVGVKHRFNVKLEIAKAEVISRELLNEVVAATNATQTQQKSNGVAVLS
ncbi:MAG: hypothetical protein GC192_11520 [Bacteroidetes bacterium]|nr:hypothetical protein [Bacteroidota bacterium]